MSHYVRWFGVRQGMRVILATQRASGGEVELRVRHLPSPLNLRLRTSDFRIYGQVIVRKEYALPLRRPPRVVIDAGANIGLTSVYYANCYPGARILAIEPEKTSFALLRKNTAFYPQITPIHAALWDKQTMLELVGRPGLYGAVRVQVPGQPSPYPVLGNVETVTIPQLMADYQVDFIDLLKVDIEGAERELFAAAKPWIEQVGVIIAELHDRFRPGCSLSFNAATRGFDYEWRRGEHTIVARPNALAANQQ